MSMIQLLILIGYKERESLPINQWINDLKTYEEALEIGLQQALKLI